MGIRFSIQCRPEVTVLRSSPPLQAHRSCWSKSCRCLGSQPPPARSEQASRMPRLHTFRNLQARSHQHSSDEERDCGSPRQTQILVHLGQVLMDPSYILLLDHWRQRRTAQRAVGDAEITQGKILADDRLNAFQVVHFYLQQGPRFDDGSGQGRRRAFLKTRRDGVADDAFQTAEFGGDLCGKL